MLVPKIGRENKELPSLVSRLVVLFAWLSVVLPRLALLLRLSPDILSNTRPPGLHHTFAPQRAARRDDPRGPGEDQARTRPGGGACTGHLTTGQRVTPIYRQLRRVYDAQRAWPPQQACISLLWAGQVSPQRGNPRMHGCCMAVACDVFYSRK